MRWHLVDRVPADTRIAAVLLLGRSLLSDTATDLVPLRDVTIHEFTPPLIVSLSSLHEYVLAAMSAV
jgi:hypothetical protein